MSVSGEVAVDKFAPRLRSGALNLIETVGQSLAAIAPHPHIRPHYLGGGCAGTFASFGFVVVDFALCIVAPMDLNRSCEVKPRHVLTAGAGATLMLFVVVGSLHPAPQYPYNELPYLLFAYMTVGAV